MSSARIRHRRNETPPPSTINSLNAPPRLNSPARTHAAPDAPIPDLLSTAVALHALDALDVAWRDHRESMLDFIDTLWTAEGAFHGSWADDEADAEYTFYGLVALGHCSV